MARHPSGQEFRVHLLMQVTSQVLEIFLTSSELELLPQQQKELALADEEKRQAELEMELDNLVDIGSEDDGESGDEEVCSLHWTFTDYS